MLFEKDADAAKEDVRVADVGFVGLRRRVDRTQHHVVAAPQ
jgi:hypothetical protein